MLFTYFVFCANLLLYFIVFTEGAQSGDLIFAMEGNVGAENFTYFSLKTTGNILLELESLEGDADLYISQKHEMPTFEPEMYDLHSATCGLDTLIISKNFKRPIGIGIYGHSAYEKSSFSFTVHDIELNENDILVGYDVIDENLSNMQKDSSKLKKNSNFNFKNKNADKKVKLMNAVPKTGFWALLEIIDLLFL